LFTSKKISQGILGIYFFAPGLFCNFELSDEEKNTQAQSYCGKTLLLRRSAKQDLILINGADKRTFNNCRERAPPLPPHSDEQRAATHNVGVQQVPRARRVFLCVCMSSTAHTRFVIAFLVFPPK
jgi:hypothetical protein